MFLLEDFYSRHLFFCDHPFCMNQLDWVVLYILPKSCVTVQYELGLYNKIV